MQQMSVFAEGLCEVPQRVFSGEGAVSACNRLLRPKLVRLRGCFGLSMVRLRDLSCFGVQAVSAS